MTCTASLSGGKVDFKTPADSTFTLEDIAIGLKRAPRFAGQTSKPWSVADHSCCMAQYAYADRAAPKGAARLALWHDAAEAFMGDVPLPLKAMIPQFSKIEKRLRDEMFRRWCVGEDEASWEYVNRLDKAALMAENELLGRAAWPSWTALSTDKEDPELRQGYLAHMRQSMAIDDGRITWLALDTHLWRKLDNPEDLI